MHDSPLVTDIVDGGQVLHCQMDAGHRHAACEQCKYGSKCQSSDPIATWCIPLPQSQHLKQSNVTNGQHKELRKSYPASDFGNKDSHDNHNKQSIEPSVRAKLDEEVEVALSNDSSDPLH